LQLVVSDERFKTAFEIATSFAFLMFLMVALKNPGYMENPHKNNVLVGFFVVE